MTRQRTGRKWIAILSAGLLVSLSVGGCGGSRTLRDGSLGSRLFYSRCRSCHAPVDPASKTVAFWRDQLDRYAERARLTPAERDSVMAFVVRAAGGNPRER